MKAISIKQPWAWAIIYAGKDVENRTWIPRDNYRGPLLIHASKTFDMEGYLWILENSPKLFKTEIIMPGPKRFDMGGVIGKVNFKNVCRHLDISPWMFGPWGWVFENPKPIDFIPYKGQLGLFNIPDKVLR